MVKSGDGLPWWVNAVYKVGVPTAIACYLVYILAGKVQTNVEAVQSVLSQHELEQQHFLNELNRDSKLQLKMLETMCIHSSKTDEQRQECIQ